MPCPVRTFNHGPGSLIVVLRDYDSSVGAPVQHPQHVTGGQRRDQQLFGVVTRFIAAKRGIGGTGDGHALPRSAKLMIAAVSTVIRRALAIVAGPSGFDTVRMLSGHRSNW